MKSYANRLGRSMVALLLPWMAASASTAASEPPSRAATVSIDDGAVIGTVRNDYAQFLGIPYATPPIGELRWQPPRRHASWTGKREASRYANICPQKAQFAVFSRASVTEDCLYLNVFTTLPVSTLRPVLVWIHGGGLVGGESDDYDASKFVRDGKLVVVTFNYRLGRLGYFPRERRESHGPVIANYGLLDQQFALRWVRRNIRAFGGDPGNVTIAGESAGAESAYALLASPGAAGLFRRAIVESGGYTPHMPAIADEASKGKAFASAVGCPDQSLGCLRTRSVAQILAAQNDPEVALVVDGATVPLSFDTAFARGAFNRVPMLSGTTRDEARWFITPDSLPFGLPRTAADYAATLGRLYGASAKAVIAEYPVSRYNAPIDAVGAIQTDTQFACPQRTFDESIGRWVPLYRYEFDDRSAPSYMPDVGFALGAAHTSELQYLFPGFHGATGTRHDLDAAQERLSDMMVRYWSNFARTGNPNPATGGLPAWPRYSARGQQALSLRSPRPTAGRDDGTKHHCRFWRAIGSPSIW